MNYSRIGSGSQFLWPSSRSEDRQGRYASAIAQERGGTFHLNQTLQLVPPDSCIHREEFSKRHHEEKTSEGHDQRRTPKAPIPPKGSEARQEARREVEQINHEESIAGD